VHISTEISAGEWDAFVATRPDASGYHAFVWREIFRDSFGHDSEYLAALRDGRVVGVLPLVIFRSRLFGRFLVSLPFVNYGGVLTADDEAADELLAAATASARRIGARYVELRHVEQRFSRLPSRSHKVAMRLALPATREAAWTGLDRKVRNQIRKAESSGLTTVSGGLELLDDFYAVFARNMRDLGTPVYGRRFFQSILTTLPDRARCVVVRSGQRAEAAAITLTWRDTIEAPWASSLKSSRPISANTLLYWSILERAIAAGLRTFDLGRSSPDSGPYHFKRQWGATSQPVCWEYALAAARSLPNLSPSNPSFSPAIALWKRLPLPLATFIGPHIVRSIP